LVSDRGFSFDGEDLLISVRAVPGASNEDIAWEEDHLKVRLTAQAQDGKANKRLAKLLGKYFGVPQSAVTIVKGLTSRTKSVRIHTPGRLPDFIEG